METSVGEKPISLIILLKNLLKKNNLKGNAIFTVVGTFTNNFFFTKN
jgi:hypothetical protein